MRERKERDEEETLFLSLRGFTFFFFLAFRAVGKRIGRGPLRVKTNNNRNEKKSNDPSLAILTIPSQHRAEAFWVPFPRDLSLFNATTLWPSRKLLFQMYGQ